MKTGSRKEHNIYTDLCTCGSGIITKQCCFADLNTRPPGLRTGYSHPKCYANSLNDCSEKLSHEHYISKGVLGLLGSGQAEAKGVSWLPEEGITTLDPEALSAKMLCDRHNAALSPLDELAIKFFRFTRGDTESHMELIIQGYELERWMLKLLCGVMFKGLARVTIPTGKRLNPTIPPKAFLETLFYRAPIPPGRGLFYPLEHKRSEPNKSIDIGVIAKDPLGILGIMFRIGYFRLGFVTGIIHSVPQTPSEAGIIYHPSCIVISGHGLDREIHFGWPEGKVAYLTIESHERSDP
jgi:hypothetical protein